MPFLLFLLIRTNTIKDTVTTSSNKMTTTTAPPIPALLLLNFEFLKVLPVVELLFSSTDEILSVIPVPEVE